MTFKKFVTTTELEDNDITVFKKWLANSKFPASNSPDAHIIFFSFNPVPVGDKIIIGYKKAVIAYFNYDKNLLNKTYKNNQQNLLETINKI